MKTWTGVSALRPVAVLIGWTAKDCCFYDMTLFSVLIKTRCACVGLAIFRDSLTRLLALSVLTLFSVLSKMPANRRASLHILP
jgi:hypothetical protein